MLKPHRLVGWWLSGGLVALSAPALAQSSAAFPEDPPANVTPAPARPPVAPAPSPTFRPPPAPAAPVPAPATASPPVRLPPAAPAAPVVGREQAPIPVDGDPRPPILPYRHGFPVPPGYEIVKRPATGLLAGGLVGLGIAYTTGVVFAAVNGFENGTGWLAVPIVGPWGAIGSRDYETCRTRTVAEAKACVRNAVKEVQVITFFAVDGIGQLAGGLVTLAGLVSSKEELIRSDLVEKVQVSVVPPVQGSPWAVSVSGQF
jgi:hypothetical protein